MEIQKVSGKKKKRSAGYRTWRLYPLTPTIPITSKLQRGAYLGRAAVNLNSDTAALSQSLRPAKMLADLLSWELMLSGDCDHKNATKSKALGASFLFPVQRDKVPQRQQAEISSLHPSRITYWNPPQQPCPSRVCAGDNGIFRCHREPNLSSSTLLLTTGQVA